MAEEFVNGEKTRQRGQRQTPIHNVPDEKGRKMKHWYASKTNEIPWCSAYGGRYS
jgi:hypothetical protein